MTSCPEAQLWHGSLSALVDGEDPERPRAQVEAHLDRCQPCRQWLADARAQARWLATAVRPGRDLTSHLVGITEAHICSCHTGGACECSNCQCEECTCHEAS